MRYFFLKLFENYKWLFNPHMSKHHGIFLLMKSAGLTQSHWRTRRIMHVFVLGGRLIGIFNAHFKDSLFDTFLRVAVYEKMIDGKLKFSVTFLFFHRKEKGWSHTPNSVIQSPYLDFPEFAEYVGDARILSQTRGILDRVKERSKIKPIPPVNEQLKMDFQSRS